MGAINGMLGMMTQMMSCFVTMGMMNQMMPMIGMMFGAMQPQQLQPVYMQPMQPAPQQTGNPIGFAPAK